VPLAADRQHHRLAGFKRAPDNLLVLIDADFQAPSVPAKSFVYLVAAGAADAFRHIDPLRGPMD
jgi:hypothetical protein